MSKAERRNHKQSREKVAGPTRSFDGSTLGPGGQIGPFRIEHELGRGAAGVVYLAHDTKLDRSVAIKSLPIEMIENPKALSRFTREARVLASLNHPNIATIYDELEEVNGVKYLVLEYVPGQTLAERIAKSKLKLKEILTIAQQIAEAMATAHEHGVIHRDLKPGNIKITPEGKVKVLDFGLAKALRDEASDLQSTITEPGRIIGTPAYMSPEQARGQATDKRSDIWSFGCVLYEMLTGKVPFEGETVSDTLANVLQIEPDWKKIPENTPNNVKVLIRRCLEKDQQSRLRDMGDAALEIRETIHMPIATPVASTPVVARPSRRSLKWLLSVPWIVSILLAFTLIWHLKKDRTPANQPMYTQIIPDQDAPFEPIGKASHRWGQPALCISPDGKTVVYVAKVGSDTMLCKREIGGSFINQLLPGTKGAFHPFFSPHGDWVGFFTKTELKKVSINTGSVVPVADVETPRGADWGIDGKILLSLKQGTTLSLVNEEGGKPRRIPIEGNLSANHNCPEILPDGKTALVADIFRGILAINLETGSAKSIHKNATYPKYLQNGNLLFAKDGVLHTVEFDSRQLKTIGSEEPVNSIKARVESPMGCVQMDISQNGTVVYSPGKSLLQSNFVWVSRTGKEQPLNIEKRQFGHFSLSPDGKMLGVTVGQMKREVWIYYLDREPPTKKKIADGLGPIWLNNNKEIIYMSISKDSRSVLKQSISGADEPEVLFTEDESTYFYPGCMSLDDKYFIYTQDNNLYMRDIESGQEKVPLLERDTLDWVTSFSRDGKYLALFSDLTGQTELYVTPFPDVDDIPISSSGADPAVWSKNSNELFFRNDTKFYQVSYTTEPEFTFSEPNLLFEGDYLNISGIEFDVSADGEKFLLLKSVDEDFDPHRLNIITNWFEELK